MNDKLWDDIVHYHYKFESAPIGQPFDQREIYRGEFENNTGHDIRFSNKRICNNTSAGEDFNYSNRFDQTYRRYIRTVEYNDTCIEKGGSNRIGGNMTVPARQPTLYFGMRAIAKADADINEPRATAYVNANVEYIVHCTMRIKLPESPNRFTQPGVLNVGVENVVTGVANPNDAPSDYALTGRVVTFNLKNTKNSAI